MNRIKIGIFLILIISPFRTTIGQDSTAEVDSTFEKYMNSAWEEIQEKDMSDSLQIIYAEEFYKYFQQNPDTETGGKAFGQAFLMWSNTGKSEFLREAL